MGKGFGLAAGLELLVNCPDCGLPAEIADRFSLAARRLPAAAAAGSAAAGSLSPELTLVYAGDHDDRDASCEDTAAPRILAVPAAGRPRRSTRTNG